MIFILNSKQVGKNKKLTKKMEKVLISDAFEKEDGDKHLIEMPVLLPSPKLFSKLIDGDIGGKKFKKKYMTNIIQDPDKLSLLVCIAVIAIKHKHVILTCSKQEMEYGYMDAIGTLLKERYGFKVSNKISKDDLSKKPKYSKKMLLEDFDETAGLIVSNKKEYKAFVEAIKGKSKDKDDSKKKHKKKKNYDEDGDDVLLIEDEDEVLYEKKSYVDSVKIYRPIKVLLNKNR